MHRKIDMLDRLSIFNFFLSLFVFIFLTGCDSLSEILGSKAETLKCTEDKLCCVVHEKRTRKLSYFEKDPYTGQYITKYNDDEYSHHLGSMCVKSGAECSKYKSTQFSSESNAAYSIVKEFSKTDGYYGCKSNSNVVSSYRDAARNYISKVSLNNLSFYRVKSDPADPYQCKSHCRENDVFCETIKLDEALFSDFLRIKNLISGKGNIIKKKDFMDTFGQNQDECERGDVILKHGKITNVGKGDCIAEVSDKNSNSIKVLFPEKFEASIFFNKGIDFTIDKKKSPVMISHSMKNSLLNGALSYIHIGSDMAIARIDNMCIGVSNLR